MLTNKQAIREDLKPYPVSSSQIERQLWKHSVDPDDAVNESIVSMCVIEILSQMITLGGVSEGGVSFNFDTEKAKTLLRRKCIEAGLDYTQYVAMPTVTRLE